MIATRSVSRGTLLWLALCAMACALPARVVVDQVHRWRAEIPDAYLEAEFDRQARPDQLFLFVDGSRAGLEALRVEFYLLPTERPKGVKPGGSLGPVALYWKGARVEAAINDRARGLVVEFTILIPVKVNAICLTIWGPPTRRADAQALAQGILDKFEAASSNGSGGPVPANAESEPESQLAQPVPVVAQQDGSTLWVLVAAGCLMIGFAAGWILRGAAMPPPVAMQAAPEVPVAPAPEPVAAKGPATIKRSPDDTDPGDLAQPKCRHCGAPLRVGKKTCMNCGSEVF